MSMVNVLHELENGVGLVATSVPTGILYVPEVSAVDDKAWILAICSGAPGTVATTSAYLSGCIMWVTKGANPQINSGTLDTPAWTVIS